MKKLKILLMTLFCITILISSNKIYAASSNFLISVGEGSSSITVTTDSTIDSIIADYGEGPKVEADSAFGGKSYSFYRDDPDTSETEYDDYLYVEFTSQGKIICYGSVDPSYKVSKYSYGVDYPYTDYSSLHGCLFSNDGTVEGGIFYYRYALENGNAKKIINYFTEHYMEDPTKYLKGIAMHGVAMYNAISKRLGQKTMLTFDEDVFYINEQLKEFGSSIREYLIDMDKTSTCLKGIGIREDIELANRYYYTLNPILFAVMADDNVGADFGDRTLAVFDYIPDQKLLFAGAISPNTFDLTSSVALTKDEQNKLSAGRNEYSIAKKKLYQESDIYSTVPVATSASDLVAGELKQSKKEGITAYVNAIRVAGGLPEFELSEDAFKVAQYVSTLMSYRFLVLNKQIEHKPSKPDGVSDEYYYIAMGNGKGYSENLGYSATDTTVENMKLYINMFLDDSFSTLPTFGHRRMLLYPTTKYFGYGVSPYMFSNEFDGYKDSDVYYIAWPSVGVTFLESLEEKRFKWTMQFLDKYTILPTTTATITCLNTGDSWTFDGEDKRTATYWFARITDSIESVNNKIIMYNYDIIPMEGYVYQITLHGIKEDSTSNVIDYSYRTVFEYADLDNIPTQITSISIKDPSSDYTNSPKLTKVDDADEDVYNIPIGEDVKLTAEIDTSVTDKKVTWSSSNKNVTVTQNGIVHANALTDDYVVITVSYDGSTITDQILVKPYKKIDEVRLASDDYPTGFPTMMDSGNEVFYFDLAQNESKDISIYYMPVDTTEDPTINWYVLKNGSSTKYLVGSDAYNSNIAPYLTVTIKDKENITVTAVDAELNNNRYTVLAEVIGYKGSFTGSCDVKVHVPIDDIDISTPSDNSAGISISGNSSGRSMTYTCTSSSLQSFNLQALVYPTQTTEDTTINWKSSNENVVKFSNSTSSKGTDIGVNIIKEGEATITAYTNASDYGPSCKEELHVVIKSPIESLRFSNKTGSSETVIISDGKQTTDTLTVEKLPTTNNDNVVFTSSNEDVATVDQNGKVTFLNNGKTKAFNNVSVTIKATAYKNNVETKSVSYTYTVKKKISSLAFNSSSLTVYKGSSSNGKNTLSIFPSDHTTDYDKYIVYSSDDKDIATVDSNGNITPLRNGVTTIKASLQAPYSSTGSVLSASYTLTVHTHYTGVKINTDKVVKNSNVKFTYSSIPSDADDEVFSSKIKWTSSNTSLIKFSDATTGSATVGDKTGKCKVTVSVPVIKDGSTVTYQNSVEVEITNYLKGDLDKNGIINSSDASIALDLYRNSNATSEDIAIGDMDENGIINSSDASMILDVYRNGVN